MNLGLKDRTAIVVASSRGIGRATALALAAEGANVAMCARDEQELADAAAEVADRAEASRVLAVPADVTRLEDIERLVNMTVERFGGVQILTASTGGPRPGDFLGIADDTWENVFRSVLLSAVRLSRAVFEHMREAGFGRIVFLTSTAAKQPLGDLVLSNATRPGLHGLAKTLATEYGPYGITVNCVCPGIVTGDRSEEIITYRSRQNGRDAGEILKEIEGEIPLGRRGLTHEIAAGIAFLVSEPASYITGATLSVDGGLTKSLF